MRGLWFSPRDMQFIEKVNKEVLDRMLQIVITIYKVCADQNETNIYGETTGKTGKVFYPGVNITCNITKNDMNSEATDFGPDRKQELVFQFLESKLKAVNLYPQTGDIIEYADRLFEVNNVIQDQFLGGIPEKSLSIICNCHYSRLSKSDLFIRS